MNSVEIDITQTLNKLYTLLDYCTSEKAGTVFRYIAEAKTVWEEEYNNTEKENK